jgi:hypothetical protein
MTGEVSTANNGGFIQMRLDLPEGAAEGAQRCAPGRARQFAALFRASADARHAPAVAVLPGGVRRGAGLGGDAPALRGLFRPSGAMLALVPEAARLTSLGVVAYGRDHAARIDVAEVGFY